MIDWITTAAVATVVAAVAAVLAILVAIAAWRATRRQAQIAERAEMGKLKPHVHLASVEFGRYGSTPPDLGLSLVLVNVGPGAALGIRGYIHVDRRVRYQSTALAVDLAGGGTSRKLQVDPPYEVLPDDSEEAIGKLWLEYRDLAGHFWATAVKVRLLFGLGYAGLYVIGGDRDEPRDLVCQDIQAIDHSERLISLDRLHIEPGRPRRDDVGIPWPRDWIPPSGVTIDRPPWRPRFPLFH